MAVEDRESDGAEAQKPAALNAHVEVFDRQQATATQSIAAIKNYVAESHVFDVGFLGVVQLEKEP
jgi:hypothetical protein